MSEEIQGASLAVPRALMLSLLINGVLGFAMILALMFCIGDLKAALESQETLGYPFLEIFVQAVKSKVGATLMASIIIALGICSTVGDFAASSRMLWSFSRDHGTPGWRVLVKVSLPPTSHFLYLSGFVSYRRVFHTQQNIRYLLGRSSTRYRLK